MNTLANLGLSAATINTLSQESIAQVTSDPKKEVPYVKGYEYKHPDGLNSPPEVETIHSTIPRGRWVRIQAAYDAAERVSKAIEKIGPSNSINTGVRYDSTSPEQVEPYVVVSYDTLKKSNGKVISEPSITFEEVENNTPSYVSGTAGGSENTEVIEKIPVVFEKKEKIQQEYYDTAYRPCPGGCKIDLGGTLCFSFWDYSVSRRRFLTAGHVLQNDDGSVPGQVHQPEWDKNLGYPLDSSIRVDGGQMDAGLIEYKYSDVDYTNKLAEDGGGYTDTVNKVHGWDWIANDGYQYEITHQGKSAGRNSGTIKETVAKNGKRNFWTTADQARGDSGGPHYRFDSGDGYYWLVGLHCWTNDGTDSGAIALDKIMNDEYNLAL
ncbi:hypothetical protein [Halorussus lipolyticus]|nr:hypothetical protein [Halorussus sp. DT80]